MSNSDYGVGAIAKEAMDLLEEINLQENLDEALCRQLMATAPTDMQAREIIHLKRCLLGEVIDTLAILAAAEREIVPLGRLVLAQAVDRVLDLVDGFE